MNRLAIFLVGAIVLIMFNAAVVLPLLRAALPDATTALVAIIVWCIVTGTVYGFWAITKLWTNNRREIK